MNNVALFVSLMTVIVIVLAVIYACPISELLRAKAEKEKRLAGESLSRLSLNQSEADKIDAERALIEFDLFRNLRTSTKLATDFRAFRRGDWPPTSEIQEAKTEKTPRPKA